MFKMVPKGRQGGILQTPPQRQQWVVPKAQAGMAMMNPLQAQVTSPQLLEQLNTTTLQPMTPKAVPPVGGAGMSGGAVGAAAGAVSAIGATAIDAFSADAGTDAFGIEEPENAGGAIAKSTLSGAASGAATGAMFGPWGAAVGGVIGGASGFIKGKKGAKEDEAAYEKAHGKARSGFIQNQDQAAFQAMTAKSGMKFGVSINKITSNTKALTPIFKGGGKLTNSVIAKGKLHKENNNLGEKDKGIPVVDADGNKKYELEKEEWITSSPVTKEIEAKAMRFIQSNKDADLEELGKFVSQQLLANTQDNSSKYGMEVKK